MNFLKREFNSLKNKKSLVLFSGLLFLLSASSVLAVSLEMPLPGTAGKNISNPGQYIQYFFIFGLSLIGFLAVAALVVGGIMWMTGGSITSTEKARNIIIGAVSGVVLLLCSYLLLWTIDPSLVNLTPHIAPVGQMAKPAAPAQGGSINCDPTTQVWSATQGKCVAKPSGYGTTQCQKGSSTCTEAICVPGGCAYGFQQWNQSQCCCINLPTGVCD